MSGLTDQLRMEVLTPTPYAFLLGYSRIGDQLTTALQENLTHWKPYACNIREVQMVRGGAPEGATTRLSSGVATISLKDEGDPTTDPIFAPGRPVRLLYSGTEMKYAWDLTWPKQQPLVDLRWSDPNLAATLTFTADGVRIQCPAKASASHTVRVFLRCPDYDAPTPVDYQAIVNLRTNATPAPGLWGYESNRYKYIGKPTEQFADMYSFDTSEQFTLTTDGICLLFVHAAGNALDVTLRYAWLFASDSAVSQVVFTGTQQTPRMVPDRKTTGYTTELTVHDAYNPIAATMRYGVVAPGGAGIQTPMERITALMDSAPVPYRIADQMRDPHRPIPTSSGWSTWGNLTNATRYRQHSTFLAQAPDEIGVWLRITLTGASTYAAGAHGLQTTLTDLIPGQFYRVSATIRATWGSHVTTEPSGWIQQWMGRVDGGPWSTPVFSGNVLDPATLSVTFQASAATAVFQVANGEALATGYTSGVVEAYVVLEPNLHEVDPYMLKDVVYESNLANHLQLAADSAGLTWWVNPDNILTVTNTPKAMPWHLSDVHADRSVDPFHICYSDIDIAYDDYALVNELTINQHGRIFDAESNTWVADDESITITDATSAATYGPAGASVETSIATTPPYQNALQRRANEIFTQRATPTIAPRSITFWARDNDRAAASIDINNLIRITHRGMTFDVLVTGITRISRPNRIASHQVTLTVWSINAY